MALALLFTFKQSFYVSFLVWGRLIIIPLTNLCKYLETEGHYKLFFIATTNCFEIPKDFKV